MFKARKPPTGSIDPQPAYDIAGDHIACRKSVMTPNAINLRPGPAVFMVSRVKIIIAIWWADRVIRVAI
jgi:hypothetical protein